MQDTIRITRDPGFVYGDTLDEETLQLLDTPPPDLVLYQGKCIIKGDRTQSFPAMQGGQRLIPDLYNILVPKSVTDLRYEDRIRVVVCLSDPYMQGRVLRVVDAAGSTYRTYRRIWATDIVHGR